MEHWLHSVPPRVAPQRTKPMQVLALGLSRSGTDSLCTALKQLGYSHVYHGFDVGGGDANVRKGWSDLGEAKYVQGKALARDDFEPLLSHCEAVTDQPCACFALELIKAYPEAKVLLNYRDVDDWYPSVANTFGVLLRSWKFKYLAEFDAALYWRKRCFLLYDKHFFQGSTARHAKRIHNEHYAMIRGTVPADKLLEWKVQDGWGPLCEFLDKPVPKEDFPSGNTPAELQRRAAKLSAVAEKRAYRNIALLLTTSAAVIGFAGHQIWRK